MNYSSVGCGNMVPNYPYVSIPFIPPLTAVPSSSMLSQAKRKKMCPFFLRGTCNRGITCRFAHTQEEFDTAAVAPDLTKTRICMQWKHGACHDPNCNFAHGRGELRATGDCFKTKYCAFWLRGNCKSGSRCRHAHGEPELRRCEYSLSPLQAQAVRSWKRTGVREGECVNRLIAQVIPELRSRDPVAVADALKRAVSLQISQEPSTACSSQETTEGDTPGGDDDDSCEHWRGESQWKSPWMSQRGNVESTWQRNAYQLLQWSDEDTKNSFVKGEETLSHDYSMRSVSTTGSTPDNRFPQVMESNLGSFNKSETVMQDRYLDLPI
eukprot:GHVL01035548.1.p1 GENE.GHVL01035548.1~~GHVL01035548.1.p1  ORF type:complete len:351 (+),score=59.85 GHVL01035548.1:84-1055(+)